MDETRQSLLLRAQTGETDAWKDLTDLYRPLILGWLNRQGVPAGDLEDLSQEVLLSVVKHLAGFQHSGHRGAFRSWLKRAQPSGKATPHVDIDFDVLATQLERLHLRAVAGRIRC